ncbi:MAG: epoxyqueuosine reductase QueH [Lachnospiraceae bacterium]|nr:epoxyqueuosine reductase QueH [Lachnospiraceae bacterium]
MQKVNYQRKLEDTIAQLQREGRVPTLLLHSCCAPCSSYVLEYLSDFFRITVLYYNPNISPAEEYKARVAEQKRLISELPVKHPVAFLEGEYRPEHFYHAVKGLEHCTEGGDRCTVCYELRLREAAEAAAGGGFEFFTTTLSISPLKNAEKLNSIGRSLSEEYGVSYLYSDFKKKNGYKRSIELSAQYHLYRQDYCGCVFSKEEQRNR